MVSKDLTKKAAEMLLQGATLLSEPCPYCKGVRVMKEGHALCISCGREPEKKQVPVVDQKEIRTSLSETLEKKLAILSKELEDDKKDQHKTLQSNGSILMATLHFRIV